MLIVSNNSEIVLNKNLIVFLEKRTHPDGKLIQYFAVNSSGSIEINEKQYETLSKEFLK